MIYIFFEPTELKKQESVEVPLMELQNFTIYELDQEGLKSRLKGANSSRYSDRDVIEKIDFTSSATNMVSSIQAGIGTHKSEDILLEDDVVYKREDGVIFKSEMAHYEKKSAIFSTQKDFVIYKGKNSTVGEALMYDSKNKTTKAQNIKTVFQLQERNQ